MISTVLVASLLAPAAPQADAIELRPRAVRTWTLELPADPFRPVSGSIPLPHAGGDGFPVEPRGMGFAVDTDGDGAVDRVIEGREHPETKVRHARVTLTGRDASGAELRYPVRLEVRSAGWCWATSSVLTGEIEGTPVTVVDMDGNGSFGDIGRDAIAVGGSEVASFLGSTIHAGGALRSLEIDGNRAAVAPYEGETGTLDLLGAFEGRGVMLGAIVKSVNGRHSFELSRAEDGLTVPLGRYRLVSATLGLGESRVTCDGRGMSSIRVKEDEESSPRWGGPVKASFTYGMKDGKVILDPAQVRYEGAAGERWTGWDPVGKSPTFAIKEKDTGEVLVDAVFPGSC